MVIFFPQMFFNIYVVFNTIKGHNKVGRKEHFINGSVPSTWPPGKHPNMFFEAKSRAWDEHTYITIYKTDNQQGPTT